MVYLAFCYSGFGDFIRNDNELYDYSESDVVTALWEGVSFSFACCAAFSGFLDD